MVSSVIERHDVTDGTCPAAEVPLRYGLTAIDENDTQRNRKKSQKFFLFGGKVVSLHTIGFGSAILSKLHCARLALSLHTIGFG